MLYSYEIVSERPSRITYESVHLFISRENDKKNTMKGCLGKAAQGDQRPKRLVPEQSEKGKWIETHDDMISWESWIV
jgi:hypothetical protein